MRTDLSGASWFKSSYSQHGGECVEVAHTADAVGVRDSKNPAGFALIFAPAEWDAFLRTISTGS
ncbi:DUF397 domain-containing protein [Nocardia speluncae]|uniref:DUF397 domain-containing protein n=1 Tax=Nocardia speluncae TaxID=419477 RepID=A0A846XIK2_9NOCA|nr:DUF397 domain-containing protein [Nocardia speluncae]NKY35337.1 DUF397 domain-containing protein [Nocardia speluncae]